MKTIFEKIEDRNYLVTKGQIGEVTRQHVQGEATVVLARGVYLKALVANTQEALGAPVRARAASASRFGAVSDEMRAEHIKALEKVHSGFYEEVLANIPDGPAAQRNKDSGYARTAKSRLRTWIKAGGDIRTLAAPKVTAKSIKVARADVPRTAEQVKSVMLRQATGISEAVSALADLDKQSAIEAVETVMSQLAVKLVELGVTATRDPQQAIDEHRPFRLKEGVFWPAPRLEAAA